MVHGRNSPACLVPSPRWCRAAEDWNHAAMILNLKPEPVETRLHSFEQMLPR